MNAIVRFIVSQAPKQGSPFANEDPGLLREGSSSRILPLMRHVWALLGPGVGAVDELFDVCITISVAV